MKIRKLLIISPLGILLLAGLVIAWWYLGDDSWIEGKIEETVSEMTGRSLSIDGGLSIDWSTHPILYAEDIHFSNPDWTIHSDLAKLDKLEVSIDLFSILKGQTRVNYIELGGLVIALEEGETGEKSWVFPSDQEEPVTNDDTVPGELPVSIDRISMSGFSLLHEASDREVPLDFNLDQFEWLQNSDQQIQVDTDGQFGGEEFNLTGDLGPLNALVTGGKTSHDIRLTLGGIELQSRGSIEKLSTLSGANIKLTFSGPEFEWILTQLALPEFSHGDFDFSLDLKTEGGLTHLDLDGDLGSLQVFARGNLKDLTDTVNLTADVSGDDLGGLLEVAGVSGVPRKPFKLNVDVGHSSGVYSLQTLALETGGNQLSVTGQVGDWPQLADTALRFSVTGPDLRSWGQVLTTDMLPDTDFDLSGSISRNGVQPASTDTRLRLGKSLVRLSGSLGKLPSMTGADLTITADGPVDGAVVQVLKLEGIPGETFSLKAALERDSSYIYVNDASFDLAGNHLELSGKLGSWPDIQGSHLVFSLEGPDLSIWSSISKMDMLPESAFSLNGEMSKTASGFGLDMVTLNLGDSNIAVNGTVGEWPGLIDTALIIEASGPNLAEFQFVPGLPELPVLPFQINGNMGMVEAGPTFDNFNLLLGDNSLRLHGLLSLNDSSTESNFQSRMIFPDIAEIGSLFGVEGLPGERLSMNGDFRRLPDGWAFQLSNGSFASASFESQGRYIEKDDRQLVEANSHVSAPNLARLASIAGVENLPQQAVDIKGFVGYDAGQIEVRDLQGKLGDTVFEVFAKTTDMATWSGSEITLTASGLSIAQLVDYPVPDEPFRLDVKVKGTPTAFHIGPFDMEMGASDLSGELSVDLTEKPKASGAFKSSYLDLSWIQSSNEEPADNKTPVEQDKRDFLIPDDQIGFSRIDFGDSDIEVAFDKIDLENSRISDVYIHSWIKDGNFYLDPFQTRGEGGGLLSGKLSVEREVGSDFTVIMLDAKGNDVKLGIGTVEGQDPSTISQSDIVAKLSGAGVTYRDLARSLNGHIEIVQGPGLTGNAGLGLIFGDFIGELLDTVNPFSKTEKFSKNECAVAVVNIDSGLVTVEPVVSQSDKMTLVAKGVVDLHTEKIQFTFNTKLRKGLGLSASMVVNPFVSVTGTLLSPFIGLDPTAVVVQGTVAVATVGISLLAKSLSDRFLSSKDPCGDALKKSREQSTSSQKQRK